MSSTRPHPQWLLQALDSKSYIDDAWTVLTVRERQRSLARAASHERKPRRFGFEDAVDPNLQKHYSISVGLSPANRLLNRYMDVVPYDRNRVKPPGSMDRYLNARYAAPKTLKERPVN